MLIGRNVRLIVLIVVFIAAGLTVAYVYSAGKKLTKKRDQVNDLQTSRRIEKEVPDRPKGIPLSAQWAGSVDGGAWIECRIEPQLNMNYCVAYNYQSGEVSTEGYYRMSDTKDAAQRDELLLDGFDGARIYLANGRVLEPINDDQKFLATNSDIRCEGNAYTSKTEPRNKTQEYCYDLQKRLIESSLRGNVEQIKKALAAGAHIEGTYSSSLPALQCAAMMGQANAVSTLLNNGADVNRVVALGNTALTVAVFEGHAEVVKILLDSGAHVRDYDGRRTAEEIAQSHANKEILEMLKAAQTNN